MLNHLTKIMGYIKLSAEIENTNITSLQLMRNKLSKFGFEKEGILKNNFGKDITCELWAYSQ